MIISRQGVASLLGMPYVENRFDMRNGGNYGVVVTLKPSKNRKERICLTNLQKREEV